MRHFLKNHPAFGCLKAFGLGGILVGGLPPFNQLWLVPCVLSLALLCVLKRPSRRAAIVWGLCFGAGYFLVGIYWINHALLLDPLFFWLILPTSLILPAWMGLYTAFTTGTTWYLHHRFRLSPWMTLLVWSTSWVVGEWVRGWLMTGFPWNPMALMVADYLPFLQMLPFVGMLGGSFLVVLLGSWGYWIVRAPTKWVPMLLWIALVGGLYGGGVWQLRSHPTVMTPHTVVVVQPNHTQGIALTADERVALIRDTLDLTVSAIKESPPTGPYLIVWPESGVHFVLNQYPLLERWLQSRLPPEAVLLVGTTRADTTTPEVPMLNSMAAITHKGPTLYYDKHHLVPFGEYVPLASYLKHFIELKSITGTAGDFKEGTGPTTLTLPAPFMGAAIAASICYEGVYAHDSAHHTQRPMAMINITNDAWFGTSHGPHQHFHITRLQAIAAGLSMVRSAVTGISAIMDAQGRILQYKGLGERGTLVGPLPQSLGHPTWASHLGVLAPMLLMAAFWILTGIIYVVMLNRNRPPSTKRTP